MIPDPVQSVQLNAQIKYMVPAIVRLNFFTVLVFGKYIKSITFAGRFCFEGTLNI